MGMTMTQKILVAYAKLPSIREAQLIKKDLDLVYSCQLKFELWFIERICSNSN